MPRLNFSQRLTDPLQRRRAAYALPTLFTAGNRVLRTKAHALVPRGSTLARVGLERDTFQRLLGRKTEASVTKKQMPALNAALLSNVQFLTRSGWR